MTTPLTAKQLIEELSKLPQDAPIILANASEDGFYEAARSVEQVRVYESGPGYEEGVFLDDDDEELDGEEIVHAYVISRRG